MKSLSIFPWAAALGAVVFSTSAIAGNLTMTLTSYQPQSPTYAGHAGAGTFNDPAALEFFNVSAQSGNPITFPTSLELFCIELQETIVNGSSHAFEVVGPDQGSKDVSMGLSANIGLNGIGNTRANNLEILYGHVFGTNYNPSTVLSTDDLKSSFQLAVWELSHDDNFDLKNVSTNGFYLSTTGTVVDDAQALVTWVQANQGASKMELAALHLDGVQDFLVPIPEPSTYAMLCGLAVLTAALWHRRKDAMVAV